MEASHKASDSLSRLKEDIQEVHNDVDACALQLTADCWSGSPLDIDGLIDVQACSCTQLLCQSMANQTYQSLSGLVHCLPYHVARAADYQKFFHGVKHICTELDSWVRLLEQMHAQVIVASVDGLMEAIVSITGGLLKLQDRIQSLTASACDIVPLRYRKEKVDRRLQLRALVSYLGSDGFIVSEKAEYVLVDNSDPMLWLVEDSNGKRGRVPPLIMALLPPCTEATESASRLKHRMLSLWISSLRLFRGPCVRFATRYIAGRATSSEFAELDSDIRNEILLLLQGLTQSLIEGHAGACGALFLPEGGLGVPTDVNHPDIQRLTEAVTTLYASILVLPPKIGDLTQDVPINRDSCDDLTPWQKLWKLSRRLEDMKDYAVHYGVHDAQGPSRSSFWISSGRTFVSSAFIERIKTSPADAATCNTQQADIAYICEKSLAAFDESAYQAIPRDNAEAAVRLAQDIVRKSCSLRDPDVSGARPAGGSSSSGSAVVGGPASRLRKRGSLVRQKSSLDEHSTVANATVTATAAAGEPLASECEEVFVVLDVMNTKLGKCVSPSLALRHGLVDPNKRSFIDTATGSRLPLDEAVARGLVKVQQASGLVNGYHGDGSSEQQVVVEGASPDTVPKAYTIRSVVDPRTSSRVSVPYALSAGLVDPVAGTFCDPATRRSVPLEVALDDGRLEAFPCDATAAAAAPAMSFAVGLGCTPPDSPAVLTAAGAAAAGGMGAAHRGSGGCTVRVYGARRKSAKFVFPGVDMHDPNNVAYKALSDCMDAGVRGVTDAAGRPLSIREAYSQKLLKFDSLTYESASSGPLPVEDAAAQGLIKMAAAQALLGACHKLSLAALAENGTLDLSSGTVTVDGASERQPLDAAIESGAVEPYAIFCRDADGRLASLGHVLKERKAQALVAEGNAGIEEAASTVGLLSAGRLHPSIGGLSKALREAFVLEQLSSLLDFRDVSMLSGGGGLDKVGAEAVRSVPLDEAVRSGLFILDRAMVLKPDTGCPVELHEAVEFGLVKASAAKDLYHAINSLSLQQALANNSQPSDGSSAADTAASSATGEHHQPAVAAGSTPNRAAVAALRAALADGQLSPESIYLVELLTRPGEPRVSSLACLQDEGVFDPTDCTFAAAAADKRLPLDEAISAGLVRPAVHYWDFLHDEPVPLSELLPSRCITDRSPLVIPGGNGAAASVAAVSGAVPMRYEDGTTGRLPEPVSVAVRDALTAKVLSYGTPVRYDRESGTVSLVDPDLPLVVPLARVPGILEWLSDVEQKLAEQREPSETCDGLVAQIQQLEAIQSELEQRKAEVTVLVDASCRLLDERKTADKSEFVQQQHQQLRTAAADMKATHEKTNRQLRNQLKQLRSMKGFLDDFHDKRTSFDSWAEEAQRKLDDTEKGPINLGALEEMANEQKQIQDEQTQMETKLMGMQTTGLKFMAEAKEYEKLVDSLRQTVHRPLRKSSAPATANSSLPHVVQTTIDAATEKLRFVRSRSSTLRERLQHMAQKARRYAEQELAMCAWLPAAETRASELEALSTAALSSAAASASATMSSGDLERIRQALSAVNSLAAETAAQRPACAALRSAADDLTSGLVAMPASSRIAEAVIQSTSDNEARHAALAERLLSQQRLLEAAVLDAQDVDRAVEAVAHELEAAAQRLGLAASGSGGRAVLGDKPPLSLDRGIVRAELATLHDLDSAAEGACSQADQLLQRLGSDASDGERVQRLEAARLLVAAARESGALRIAELGTLAVRLDGLAAACDGLQRWVVDVVADLQHATSAADPAAVRLHCHEQYTAKRSRQPELDTIKADVDALVGDPRSTHRHCLIDLQADLCGKWRDLTDLLVDLNVMQALKDIEEQLAYFVKIEMGLTKLVHYPADTGQLQALYREHQASHSTLEKKKDDCLELIQKCSLMLRESSREDDSSSSVRLIDARQLITNVWKLSSERLRVFDELLPLVKHFADTRASLRSWLAEVMSELNAASLPCSSVEDIKKQQETIKHSARFIDDQKPVVDDLGNTARDVSAVIGAAAEAAVLLASAAAEVSAQFEAARAAAHGRLADLAELLRSATTEVTDAIDGMLDELVQIQIIVENADGIAATVDKIREQIEENRGLTEDADRRQLAIAGIKLSADKLLAQIREQEEQDIFDEDKPLVDAEDIELKINEMESLNEKIMQKTELRGRYLTEALSAAGEFWSIYDDLMHTFRDIQDSIRAQDPPQSDVTLIQEQEKEQKEIKEALRTAIPKLEVIRKMSENLVPLVGESGRVEIHRSIEEADDTFEDIGDKMNERQANLREAMENASRLEEEIEAILSWLPKFEEKMESMRTGSLDMRSLRIHIEEIKILKLQMSSKCIAVEAVKSQVAALRSSGTAEESAQSAVSDIVSRWNTLKMLIAVKEQELHDNLIQLGEVDTALEEMNGYLQQVEDDLRQIGNVYGDPKFIETHLKKIKMFEDDLLCQEPALSTLNQTITHMAHRNQTEMLRSSPLLQKQMEMNALFSSVSTLIRDNRNRLNDKLTVVKSHLGEVDDLVNWFVEFEETLKSVKTIGALPETAQKQCEKFNDHLTMLNSKSDYAHRLLIAGDDMMTSFNCHPFHTVQLRSALSRLKRSCESAKKQAKKKKQKLQEHLQNVTGFHSVMKVFSDWLANCEHSLGKFKNPSKIVETIEQQAKAHKDFQEDVEAHREIVERLDRTGTYLKYYGAKNDAIVIRNQLIAIKLRWKRLLWKTDERGRLLQRCRREDMRFENDWKTLIQWLTQTKEAMDLAIEQNPSSSRTRDLIEEIKRMELQMTRKYPRYFSTIRLGRSLKDRCTKGDPEKEILGSMVDELKTKWAILRTELSQRQTHLDEKLLESGRLQEAAKSLAEWLSKYEEVLSEDSPLLGDLDTVNVLLEQHRAFEEEMQNRRAVLNTLQQACSPQDGTAVAQLQQLLTRFERVQALCASRSSKLQDSLALATEFQAAVNQLRDFLPQAENELKHQPLPESAAAIIALVETHDRFEEQLEHVVPVVDRIKVVGEEIANHCHPNAVRFVKYYLTITSTRWEQLLERSRARRAKLQEALATIEGNMALLEELIVWLSDAEVLLFTKEEDDIPENIALVEDLLKQHSDFHDELAEKGKEVEKFAALQLEQSVRPQTPRGKSSQPSDSSSLSVSKLTSKWKSVWKMSADRKKRLQEELERLIELESVRNFDFDVWRKRYLEWVKTKKLRITDFFRQQERNEDGTMCKDEFVAGMLSSKFPTNKAELSAVFAHFDRDRTGKINYKEFIDALRLVGKKPAQPLTESEKIHDEIEREVAQCKCRVQFKCEKVDEGKYRFGEAQKLVLVRFLNSTVMVRVGGGWVTLEKFLENHDPCKAKGRTNTELREQLAASADGNQTRATFARRTAPTPTRGLGSTPTAPSPAPGATGTAAETGHGASGGMQLSSRHPLSGSTDCLSPAPSGAAGHTGTLPGRRSLSALHRSKILPAAHSMVDLAGELPSPAQDYQGRYGSGGTLPRSGAKTPTQLLQQRPSSTTPGSSKSAAAKKPGATGLRSVSQTPPPASH